MYIRVCVCVCVCVCRCKRARPLSLNSNSCFIHYAPTDIYLHVCMYVYIHARMYARMYVCMQVEASASSLNSNTCFILYAPTGAVFLWLGHWADMQQRNIASYAAQRHQQVVGCLSRWKGHVAAY